MYDDDNKLLSAVTCDNPTGAIMTLFLFLHLNRIIILLYFTLKYFEIIKENNARWIIRIAHFISFYFVSESNYLTLGWVLSQQQQQK